MGATSAANRKEKPVERWLVGSVAAVCLFVTGLALTRLLYEWRFPLLLELGRPPAVLIVAVSFATLGAIVAHQFYCGFNDGFYLFPLLFNLVWLIDPSTDLGQSRFIFVASLWLALVLYANRRAGERSDQLWRRMGSLFIALALVPVYLLTMSHAVGEADTFEFQVVAPQLGIAHPTGYPLYLLLGRLFSWLPWGSVAWRVNLASVVFAVAAAIVLFLMTYRLLRRPLPAITGAIALGLTPIFWSQAIIAEVYTLHALMVAVALRLMVRILDEQKRRLAGGQLVLFDNRKALIALAFVLGLGLTNHLTTLFLLPAAAVTFTFYAVDTVRISKRSAISGPRSIVWLLFLMAIAFLLPLLLYAYLPLRWQAVNGEAMGLSRFVDWVAGGRFQGALQWDAWRRDPTRFAIIGRLILAAWGWFYLGLATIGFFYLIKRLWPAALILLLTACGFTFYALNYYVPDLAVFLIPTHLVIAVGVGSGISAVYSMLNAGLRRVSAAVSSPSTGYLLMAGLFVMAMLPALARAADLWSTIDQSARDGGETWAKGVLGRPLRRGAAILADSEKIAPLYYLQQTEGLRPDLDIMVLPDEQAYRAELDSRLAAGQTVYLARFLPGLEGAYHLRSAGPLVEVSREPFTEPPVDLSAFDQLIGPVHLLGYVIEPVSTVDPGSTALTLYWTLDQPLDSGQPLPVLYVRWLGPKGDETVVAGRHPVQNYYPINAWRPGEVVVDTHYLPRPAGGCEKDEATCRLDIQIAAAPRFTPVSDLSWQTVTSVEVNSTPGPVGQPQRSYFDGFALDGVDLPAQARPGSSIPLRYSGFGDGDTLSFLLVPVHATSSFIFLAEQAPSGDIVAARSTVFANNLVATETTGPHAVIALPHDELRSACHWLAWPTTGCIIAEIELSGAPLPEGAVNFADRIALMSLELPQPVVEPGGQLPVEITWQGLAPMAENYTVFVQVLDAQDRIVGQVDAWPVQGTYPTSQWRPGQAVDDSYIVQLSEDIPPGDYRVHVGIYLLGTLQRLPVLDASGQPVDDKVEVQVTGD